MSSDDSEMWAERKQQSKVKKLKNIIGSLYILEERKIEYKILNESLGHYRVIDFDFWPSTGKFYNQKTKEKGRGVFNLIKRLK